MIQSDWSFDLRRVVVVGTSGCGKTTFARELSILLDLPHIELDALYWQPQWVARPLTEFRCLVEEQASGECWVADGNYSMVREPLWRRATDVVWLNYSFALVFSRVISRTVSRWVTREELFSGNRESLRMSFFSRNSILLWVVQTFRRNRLQYSALQSSDDWQHIRFWEFRRPSQASTFLSRCTSIAQARTAADGQVASR
jgi:adenylate kinase family enzyme